MLDQKEIGIRLLRLREKSGYSQEELANMIGISRPSLTQIENGNRNVSAAELQLFSHHLKFSLDAFFSKSFGVEPVSKRERQEETIKLKERISVPRLNATKFKQVLLYILERCAGKPNVGETVLYKLLYFIEFNYFELYEEHLVGATFRKLPYGPVPQRLDTILAEMQEKSQLKMVKTQYFDKLQKRYIPLEKPDLTVLKASEKEVIDRVVDQFSDYSATGISDYSHKDMPWLATENGEVISYELAFYREAPYTVRVYDEDENGQNSR
jgi:transcriptional regulator with XRE-family HTH domain